jgi:hypothetical protein
MTNENSFLLMEIRVNEEMRWDEKTRAFCRNSSNIALLDFAEGLWWSINHDGELLAADASMEDRAYREVVRERMELELRICQIEMLRRHRQAHRGAGYPVEFARASNLLNQARNRIREEISLAEVIGDLGGAVQIGRRESHAACPRCGGKDRFVIWPAPNSRGWCRQCHYSPDVIAFLMEYQRCEFVNAVEWLAREYLGETLEVNT